MTSTQISGRDLHISWVEYNNLTDILAVKIHESEWQFDQIVCIARGGMFVGDALSRIFKKPLAVIVASSYRGEDGKQKKQLLISEHIAMKADTLAKRVLLVDDLIDSGESIQKVKERLQTMRPGVEIKTAVLWLKRGSDVISDFYADDEVPKETWIHQPFEAYDTISTADLAAKVRTGA